MVLYSMLQLMTSSESLLTKHHMDATVLEILNWTLWALQPAQTGTAPFFAASKLALTCSQFTTFHHAEMYAGLRLRYLCTQTRKA